MFHRYVLTALVITLGAHAIPCTAQDWCMKSSGDCFEAHGGTGCDCSACCRLVCDSDPYCCNGEWDSECVILADLLCRLDCNSNGVPDPLDICLNSSEDCNGNNVPDECDDCNSNGSADFIDILTGISSDCNNNCDPDECDIIYGISKDCNNDGTPDECEIASDCNGNGTIDLDDGPTFCPKAGVIAVDLIAIADPSGSVDDDSIQLLCQNVFKETVSRLQASNVLDVRAAWVSIIEDQPNSSCRDWTMPVDTPVPVCIGVEDRFIDDFNGDDSNSNGEEWGDASAVMTSPYGTYPLGTDQDGRPQAWDIRDAVLILIPISDEGPQDGGIFSDDACNCNDDASMWNLIQQAVIENVQVIPMPTSGTPLCVYDSVDPTSYMARVADLTSGSVVDARGWPLSTTTEEISLQLEDAIHTAISISPRLKCNETCRSDFNNDGVVDGADFGYLLASWGACPAPCQTDLNGDGAVDGGDVGLFLADWGPC